MDWIVTGASRGLGRALVLALAPKAGTGDRFFALARDRQRLCELRETVEHVEVIPMDVDLARLSDARSAGERLAAWARPGAVLVHNAGVWPARRELVAGIERAFALNCLAPLALQAPLLSKRRLARVLMMSAGLVVKGRFDAARTPTGRDFSAWRTYCNTKLAGAIALREVARHHPEVDFALVHPGVIRSELGARPGLLGWLLNRAKRHWEDPAQAAERLVRLLERPRWEKTSGRAPWFFEDSEQAWPFAVARDESALLGVLDRFAPEFQGASASPSCQ